MLSFMTDRPSSRSVGITIDREIAQDDEDEDARFWLRLPVAHHTELMTRALSPADIRSFAARRWDLVADEKLRFIVERFEAAGISGSRSAARRLRERWLALHPEGATDADREADLKAHVALKEKLDRAHNAAVRR